MFQCMLVFFFPLGLLNLCNAFASDQKPSFGFTRGLGAIIYPLLLSGRMLFHFCLLR